MGALVILLKGAGLVVKEDCNDRVMCFVFCRARSAVAVLFLGFSGVLLVWSDYIVNCFGGNVEHK